MGDIWEAGSAGMTDEVFKNISQTYLNTPRERKIRLIAFDTRNFQFTIHTPLQTWVNEHIPAMVCNGLQKLAIIMPQDLIVELSIQQTM
ncbi:MAG: hypothetical protein RMJ87_07860 [Cytophagales bacterium]|nr:hypothetical protein [Bernardetiaceae bacterium]MDW8204927.1 hypothetical protein [Cytophagales bacterium]